MRQEVIKIDYPGSIISVNHYKYAGGKYTKRETKIWMDGLGWLIKHLHIEDWQLPLEITCDGYFKDERSTPDVHNLFKVIADAIQEATGVDDKNYRMRDGKRKIIGNQESPYLLITIKEGSGNTPKLAPDAPQSKSRASKPSIGIKYHRKVK